MGQIQGNRQVGETLFFFIKELQMQTHFLTRAGSCYLAEII